MTFVIVGEMHGDELVAYLVGPYDTRDEAKASIERWKNEPSPADAVPIRYTISDTILTPEEADQLGE